MNKKGSVYDLENYFFNKDKSIFYLRLGELSEKFIVLDLAKECKLSWFHAKVLLTSFKVNGYIDYTFNKFYIVLYTDKGIVLRDAIKSSIDNLVNVGILRKEMKRWIKK